MRIGLAIDHLDPQRGGAEHWTYQLAMGLLKLGHEVHVVAGGFNLHTERCDTLARQPQVIQHQFAGKSSRLARGAAAERILRRLDLDVVHDMGLGWYCDVFQPHGGSRLAASARNMLLAPRWLRPWKKLAAQRLPRYRQFDILMERQYGFGSIVMALSEMVRRDLRRLHGVPNERIRLVYNGVDVDRFTPEGRATIRDDVRRELNLGDQVVYLIAAHNLYLKGLPTVLRATARAVLEGMNVHLLVLGGKRLGRFRHVAKRLGLGRHIHFLGPVEDITPYYAAADVYVQPTFYDPCSLVVLEAFASGLPVITSRFNGASELMTADVHGYIMDDPVDDWLLTKLMSQLLDQRKRVHMGRAARELALRNSFTQNVKSVVSVYEEVVQAKQRISPSKRDVA